MGFWIVTAIACGLIWLWMIAESDLAQARREIARLKAMLPKEKPTNVIDVDFRRIK